MRGENRRRRKQNLEIDTSQLFNWTAKNESFMGFHDIHSKPHLFTIHLSHQWRCDVFLFWVCSMNFWVKSYLACSFQNVKLAPAWFSKAWKKAKTQLWLVTDCTGHWLFIQRKFLIHSSFLISKLWTPKPDSLMVKRWYYLLFLLLHAFQCQIILLCAILLYCYY